MSHRVQRVGFVGVGNIGGPMAQSVQGAGFELTVCDKNAEALRKFADTGARLCSNAEGCADSDVVILMVNNDDQLNDSVSGPGGLLNGLSEGNRPLVVIMSTVLPETVLGTAKTLAEKNISVIDAPVSGGAALAGQGALSIMVGGKAEDLARARPVLEAMGKKIFHCGALGNGEVAKILNNLVGLTTIMLLPEALQLGVRYGLDLRQLSSIMDVSSGRNFFSSDWDRARKQYNEFTSDLTRTASVIKIHAKDMKLALELGSEKETKMPLLQAAYDATKSLDATDFMSRVRSFSLAGE